MSEQKEISMEKFKDGLRGFNDRIERAQSEGEHNLANQIYGEQQAWIGKVKGNAPIVGGWSPKGHKTA